MELLKEITVGDSRLYVKNYDCLCCGDNFEPLPGETYPAKNTLGLRLYVHVTDRCNAHCPFCSRSRDVPAESNTNPQLFQNTLREIAPFIYSLGFSGGEPMLYPELTDELIGIADKILRPGTEIDLVTNGTNFAKLPELKNFDRLSSIHLSRHHPDDTVNRRLMNASTISSDEIRTVLAAMSDPGKVVLNCVLQKGGIQSVEDIADYLDFAVSLGICNTAFISMFSANEYCKEHYLNPNTLKLESDSDFHFWNDLHPGKHFVVWNRYRDHDFCRCLSGSYENGSGHTRFYFRCPGERRAADYCRQLVYTAENALTDGFGSMNSISF